jgi:5-oxoprolinase (ATP-hydrolysing) subunit A
VAHEAFADRALMPDGTLMPRDRPGAVLHDPDAIAQRMVAALGAGTLTTGDGSRLNLPFQSICVHGDTPGAVAIAARLRAAVEAAGFTVASFVRP